eukprot:5446808-Pleurochrysis_carterae.AAC.1
MVFRVLVRPPDVHGRAAALVARCLSTRLPPCEVHLRRHDATKLANRLVRAEQEGGELRVIPVGPVHGLQPRKRRQATAWNGEAPKQP